MSLSTLERHPTVDTQAAGSPLFTSHTPPSTRLIRVLPRKGWHNGCVICDSQIRNLGMCTWEEFAKTDWCQIYGDTACFEALKKTSDRLAELIDNLTKNIFVNKNNDIVVYEEERQNAAGLKRTYWDLSSYHQELRQIGVAAIEKEYEEKRKGVGVHVESPISVNMECFDFDESKDQTLSRVSAQVQEIENHSQQAHQTLYNLVDTEVKEAIQKQIVVIIRKMEQSQKKDKGGLCNLCVIV